jgi:N-acylneuraminate cytidylyltransferase
MIVAVIPARGGSKRIPKKNIRSFRGKPIIAYSIAAARDSLLFDRILISTDDSEIAAVARACGGETPFIRPAELSDDITGTDPVVAHAIEWLTSEGNEVAFACCVYATAPFVRPNDIQAGYRALLESGKRYAFAITSFEFAIQRAIRIVPGKGVEPFFPQWIDSRSQDLEPAYHDAGQFYWGRADAFSSGAPMFGCDSVGVVVPRYRVQDIDTPEDWERSELMYAAANAFREKE